jgi:NTE family protein
MFKIMKWALVLSGGGALGLAHIGVIKVLEQEKLKPHMIVGTSMGAIIGALLATGCNSDEMIKIAGEFNIADYLEGITYKLPFDNLLIRFLQAEEAFGNMLAKRGMDNGIKIRSYLNQLFHDKTFQETDIPFYCNAVDLLKGHEMVIHDGMLADGVYASMAYPGFFEPLERVKELLCDGSVLNNYPVWIARQFSRHNVLGVDVGHYSPISSGELENGLAIIFRSFITACQTQKKTWKDKATLTLHLDSLQGTSFDFNDESALIEAGEKGARKHIRAIKAAVKLPALTRRTIII